MHGDLITAIRAEMQGLLGSAFFFFPKLAALISDVPLVFGKKCGGF